MKELFDAVKNTHSSLFTVIFVKANGEVRKMYCKTGIKRFMKKTGKKNHSKGKQLKNIVVFDCEKKEYRSFKPESVLEFRSKNKVLKFN